MVIVNAKNNTVNCKNPDFDKEELHHVGGNRGGIDEREVTVDMERLRMGTEMIIKAFGHKIAGGRGDPIGLRDPKNQVGRTSNQRPNDRAIIFFQNVGLKCRTRMTKERRSPFSMGSSSWTFRRLAEAWDSSRAPCGPTVRSRRRAAHSRYSWSPDSRWCAAAAAGSSWSIRSPVSAGSPRQRQGREHGGKVGSGCPGRAGMGGASLSRGVVGWGVGWGEADWGPPEGLHGFRGSPGGEGGGGGGVVGGGEGDAPSSDRNL